MRIRVKFPHRWRLSFKIASSSKVYGGKLALLHYYLSSSGFASVAIAELALLMMVVQLTFGITKPQRIGWYLGRINSKQTCQRSPGNLAPITEIPEEKNDFKSDYQKGRMMK
ncbi:hypothetical protein KQX54_021474 [Cotesia glomerata]|uniref:Uncharacterized protein n=1 Tax=Cotesia glomerata TaxID=32391 RepID=A0AAV7JA74_COTGL|nr:hypothetical protein KQX54_021474 [Cotesia glomerata]